MPENGLSCSECAAPLRPGQRYCFVCGTRCGPLPGMMVGTLGAMMERGRAPEVVEEPEPPEKPREPLNWKTPLGPHMPTPRLATAAVMAMLAMGVLIGSLGHVSVEQLASAPSIILNLPSTVASGVASALGGGGGTSGSGGTRTVTVGSSTPAGSGAGSGSTTNSNSNATPTGFNGLPPIQHVFVIMLSGQGYNQTFSPAGTNKYLAKTLPDKGASVQFYYGVAASPLANEIALLSGQGPTPQTADNCPTYSQVVAAGKGSDGQVLGTGCVYPSSTQTLMGQLTTDHKTWRAYIDGMTKACSHTAGTPTLKHPYAVWTNPFVYFDSVVRSNNCRKDDVPLGQLKKDLKADSTTPTLSYIAPSPCDNGSDTPCALGAPSGLAPAVKFLTPIVNEIERSPAYKYGLIAITFDEAPQSGPHADLSSCCSQPAFPNLPAPITTTPTTTTTTPTSTTPTSTSTTPTSTTTTSTTTTTTTTPTTTPAAPATPPGGGDVGLLLLSHYIKGNSPDTIDMFNHFSLLEGIEELFGLKKIGYAKAPTLSTWTASLFTGPGP